jgi:ankyrin repeat protein
MKSAVSVFERAFIIVDGIDELDEKIRREFLKKLRVLMRISVGVRVLVSLSSRLGDGIVEVFEGEKGGISTIEVRAQKEDFITYIDGQLDQFAHFVHDDQDLGMELKQKIVGASAGNFLRVHLYMHFIKVRSRYQSLQESLLILPTTLTQQYDEVMATYMQSYEDGQSSVMTLAKQVLKWLVFSKRQLTFSELQYALAIDSECPQFNLGKLPTIEDIPNSGGMININRETKTVRIHHSQVEDYLRQTMERWCPEAEREIAQTCVAFLSLSAFETGPCKSKAECGERKLKWPLFEYSALYWSQHAQVFRSSFPQAVELLRNRQKREAAWQAMMTVPAHPLGEDKDNKWSEEYSKDTNALHVAAYCGVSSILRDLLNSEDIHIDQRDSCGFTPLAWAAYAGHQDVLKVLMSNGGSDLDARDYKGRTPISLAAENGHEKVVQLLLESGANPRLKDLDKATPFWYATAKGHATVLRHLISCEAVDVNMKVKTGRDDDAHAPISIAAVKGYTEVVSILLDDARLDPHVKDRKEHTPLRLAVQNQHEETVRVILDKVGIHSDSDLHGPDSVLYTAAEQDSEDIVQMLLAREEINLKNTPELGGSALTRAVHLGNEGIVRMLLDNDGMNILSAKWDDGRTVLHIAAFTGNATLTKLLIEKGADPNAQDGKGRTALCLAAEDAHEDVLHVLVSTY